MTKNKKIVVGVGAVIVIGLIAGIYYLAGRLTLPEAGKADMPVNIDPALTAFDQCIEAGFPIIRHYPDQCQTPDGRIFVNENPPSESDLAKAEQAIRTFMGDPNLELNYAGQARHPANFAVLSNVKQNSGGLTADTPEEWNHPVYILQQKNYINDRCEVYQYQVTIKTGQVVEISIVYPEELQHGASISGKCSNYGSLEIPLKMKTEIEQVAFAYLGRDREHTKFILRSDIQPEYISSKPGAVNPAMNEWKWEDKGISLPEGLMGDPWQHPIARIILSSGGKLVYYLNTTNLFNKN